MRGAVGHVQADAHMGEEETLLAEGALAAARYADEDDRGHGDNSGFFPGKEKPTV
jgi:hypothetical protein